MSYNGLGTYNSQALERLLLPAGAAGTPSGYSRAGAAYQQTFMPIINGPFSALPIRIGRLRGALWARSDVPPQWVPEAEEP